MQMSAIMLYACQVILKTGKWLKSQISGRMLVHYLESTGELNLDIGIKQWSERSLKPRASQTRNALIIELPCLWKI